MSKQLLEAVHEHLTEANSYWPRSAFTFAEGEAVHLERRLARAVGPAEVEICFSTVKENEDGTLDFSAVVLTRDFIVAGNLRAAAERGARYESPVGDVSVAPRSAIRGLTLHQADYFGLDYGSRGDYVSFTAIFEGMPPVVVGPPSRGARTDDRTGRLFDALQTDLAKA
jgi:hypothetical protein